MTEFEIIRRYFSPPTDHTVLAGGDDAALIAVTPGMELAVSTDVLVAGRHFFESAEPYDVGYKSMAANLSDMAAMGARPRWATLSLTLPAAEEHWLERFSSGFLDLSRANEVDLIGGDTTGGPLAICVQIMGEVAPGKALRRRGARPGDDVWVSGNLGDAALALSCLRGDFELPAQDRTYVLQRLNRPQPRVALGQGLIGLANSAIDVSDGLVADVGHIADASGVRAVVQWESVPLSAVATRHRQHPLVLRAALTGGDDYELAFTAPSDHATALELLARRVGVGLTRIGRIEAGAGVTVLDHAGKPMVLAETGFDHFR
ncbi:MAG TPA: thiamine-phosphate kinase [Burkholderiales bacterium]|nr:thiamine-phosphate kinase [Burkholderiales bacterium]